MKAGWPRQTATGGRRQTRGARQETADRKRPTRAGWQRWLAEAGHEVSSRQLPGDGRHEQDCRGRLTRACWLVTGGRNRLAAASRMVRIGPRESTDRSRPTGTDFQPQIGSELATAERCRLSSEDRSKMKAGKRKRDRTGAGARSLSVLGRRRASQEVLCATSVLMRVFRRTSCSALALHTPRILLDPPRLRFALNFENCLTSLCNFERNIMVPAK